MSATAFDRPVLTTGHRLRTVRGSAVGRPTLPVPTCSTRAHHLKDWLPALGSNQRLPVNRPF